MFARIVLCLIFAVSPTALVNEVDESDCTSSVEDLSLLSHGSLQRNLTSSEVHDTHRVPAMVPLTRQWMAALSNAFCVVAIAELFDKTWFVALLYAVLSGRRIAFVGAYSALLVHTFIAAALGIGFAGMFRASTLNFITAFVFLVFTVLYAWEWVAADPAADAMAARKEEAKEELGEQAALKPPSGQSVRFLVWQCFIAVFIAEWGDRTQIAMVALHSSLPVVPVCIGSSLAFMVLTFSAVMAASLLDGQRLSERLVIGVSVVTFLVFGVLALVDGLHARQAEMAQGAEVLRVIKNFAQ